MKLRNPTNKLVTLRLTKLGRILVLKPGDAVECDLRLRQEVSKFMKPFGLRMEIDDAELPSTVDPKRFAGTFQNEQERFNARLAKNQSDAKEVAEIWNKLDDGSQSEGNEDFSELLYTKRMEETKPPAEEKLGSTPKSAQRTLDGTATDAEEYDEDIPSEGPEYLREGPPKGVEGFGEDLSEREEWFPTRFGVEGAENDRAGTEGSSTATVEEAVEMFDKAPEMCPYTKSQLLLSVKAQLWEICDQLGLDSSGTKKDIIDRIFSFYSKTK
jgi:hypothetical protein